MQGLYAGLAPALADFHREHPGVTVRLRQAPVDDIPQALREGAVDLAIAALDAPQSRGLTTRLLLREDMVLVTALTDTPRPARPTTLAEAGRLPLVDFPPTWAIRHEVDKAFRAAAVEHTTTFEVNDILAAGDLVRYGLGVCVMPPSLAARFPNSRPAPSPRRHPPGRSGSSIPAENSHPRSLRSCATSDDRPTLIRHGEVTGPVPGRPHRRAKADATPDPAPDARPVRWRPTEDRGPLRRPRSPPPGRTPAHAAPPPQRRQGIRLLPPPAKTPEQAHDSGAEQPGAERERHGSHGGRPTRFRQ